MFTTIVVAADDAAVVLSSSRYSVNKSDAARQTCVSTQFLLRVAPLLVADVTSKIIRYELPHTSQLYSKMQQTRNSYHHCKRTLWPSRIQNDRQLLQLQSSISSYTVGRQCSLVYYTTCRFSIRFENSKNNLLYSHVFEILLWW